MVESQGDGKFKKMDFSKIGKNVVIEDRVLIFHPENIEIGAEVYIGHDAIIKGYYKNKIVIGKGSWLGQQCFFHGGGGISIGKNVGVGPGVKIITSHHEANDIKKPILHTKLKLKKVIIGDNCDIGTGAIILPGVTIGHDSIIGAGAIVTKNIPAFSVAVGNPARVLKKRK